MGVIHRIVVLVTAVGSGVALSVLKCLRQLPESYEVIGATPELSRGLVLCDAGLVDRVIELPYADESGYVGALHDAMRRWGVDAVIPGCDPELRVIAGSRHILEADTDAKVLVSDFDIVRVFTDKFDTAVWLENHGYTHPWTRRVGAHPGLTAWTERWPAILKPSKGSGSEGVYTVNSRDEVNFILKTWHADDEMVIQERVAGEEFTATVVCGPKPGEVIDCRALWRAPKIGAGHATVDRWTCKDPEVRHTAVSLARDAQIVGAVNVQGRKANGHSPSIFEVNPRFPGSTIICYHAGMNGPHLAVHAAVTGKVPMLGPNRVVHCHRGLAEFVLYKGIAEC